MTYKLNQVGRIRSGEDAGTYIKIVPDLEQTGGYYVLQSTSADLSNCFDDWVLNSPKGAPQEEKLSELEQLFLSRGWVDVLWLGEEFQKHLNGSEDDVFSVMQKTKIQDTVVFLETLCGDDEVVINIEKSNSEIVISANRSGLIHLASRILSVAEASFTGAHYHLDETAVSGVCDVAIVIAKR